MKISDRTSFELGVVLSLILAAIYVRGIDGSQAETSARVNRMADYYVKKLDTITDELKIMNDRLARIETKLSQ